MMRPATSTTTASGYAQGRRNGECGKNERRAGEAWRGDGEDVNRRFRGGTLDRGWHGKLGRGGRKDGGGELRMDKIQGTRQKDTTRDQPRHERHNERELEDRFRFRTPCHAIRMDSANDTCHPSALESSITADTSSSNLFPHETVTITLSSPRPATFHPRTTANPHLLQNQQTSPR